MKEKIILITSSLLTQITSVIGGIIITRNYTKADLGTYQQGILIFSMFAIIAAFGTPKALYYFGSRDSNLKQIFVHMVSLVIISSLIFSGIFILLWDSICHLFSNPDLKHLATYIILLLFLRAVHELLQPIAILTKRIVSASSLNIGNSFFQIIVLSAMCYYKLPLLYIYSLHILITFIEVAFSIYLIKKYSNGKWQGFDYKLTLSICKYSLPLLLSIITLIFARRVDGFIISSFSNPETMAVYSRGALEIPLGGIVVWNIANLCMPLFVKFYKENNYSKIIETLSDEVKRISIITLPVFFTFLLISKDFIVFLYTKEYINSIPVFIIYLFILPIQIYAFDTILQAMNKTSTVFYISLFSAVSNVIISIILFFIIGISGPAIGTVSSLFITNFLCLYYINKNISNSFKNWLPWGFLFKIVLICSLWLIVFIPLSGVTKNLSVFMRLMLLSSSFYIIQMVTLWKFNLVMSKDKDLIINKIKSLMKSKK